MLLTNVGENALEIACNTQQGYQEVLAALYTVNPVQQNISSKQNLLVGPITPIVPNLVPQVGDSLLQATSNAAAVVTGVIIIGGGNYGLIVGAITAGPFDATHVVTATSVTAGDSYTFTPLVTILSLWTLSQPSSATLVCTSNTNQIVNQGILSNGPTTGNFYQISSTQIITLGTDGWTSLAVLGLM